MAGEWRVHMPLILAEARADRSLFVQGQDIQGYREILSAKNQTQPTHQKPLDTHYVAGPGTEAPGME